MGRACSQNRSRQECFQNFNRRRWEDNIRMDLEKIGINTRNWFDSRQGGDYMRALVNVALNLRVSKAMALVKFEMCAIKPRVESNFSIVSPFYTRTLILPQCVCVYRAVFLLYSSISNKVKHNLYLQTSHCCKTDVENIKFFSDEWRKLRQHNAKDL